VSDALGHVFFENFMSLIHDRFCNAAKSVKISLNLFIFINSVSLSFSPLTPLSPPSLILSLYHKAYFFFLLPVPLKLSCECTAKSQLGTYIAFFKSTYDELRSISLKKMFLVSILGKLFLTKNIFIRK